jgi:hypothetical protein
MYISQIIFKKSLLPINTFPTGNNIHNDWILFNKLNGSIKCNKKMLWVQTTDGSDNISFEEFNKDVRFKI